MAATITPAKEISFSDLKPDPPETLRSPGVQETLMKEYHFDLVGLRTMLRVPEEITVSDRLRPFLLAPQKKTDCTITVQPRSVLPAPSAEGTWHGPEYYDRRNGDLLIFHCSAPGAAAFAVTQHFKDGSIEIVVLPDYVSYFTGSSGIFNRIGMETLLLQHHGLLLHASLIKFNGKGIAFAGPSGVGKSTQAQLWQDSLGAEILNGDRAALRKSELCWTAYGSPYAGTSGIYRRDSAPLAAVVVLRQAAENRLLTLGPVQALTQLYPELSVHHWDKAFVAGATDLCLELTERVPVYLLECRPDASAVQLLKKGLDL